MTDDKNDDVRPNWVKLAEESLKRLSTHPEAEGVKLLLLFSFPAVQDGQREAGGMMPGNTTMFDGATLAIAGAEMMRKALATGDGGLCQCPNCTAERQRKAH